MARHDVEEEMKRFFVDKVTDPPVLSGEQHKHLSLVLRARPGDNVILCAGDGYDRICTIKDIRRNETLLTLREKVRNESEPDISVTLFMSVMKGDKNDLVVQKATELGACEIYPVITKFVQNHERVVKTERLNKIAAEAAKQCGRSMVPIVRDTINFKDIPCMLGGFDLVVFPYENARELSLKGFLTAIDKSTVKSVAVVVGSEGGFADDETLALTNAGVVPVTLGKRILRAETANIAVLSVVMYELEQWR